MSTSHKLQDSLTRGSGCMLKYECLLLRLWVRSNFWHSLGQAWFGNPAAMLRARTHVLQHALSPTNALCLRSQRSHRASPHSYRLSRTQRLVPYSASGPWTCSGLLQLFPSCKHSFTATAQRESCKNSHSEALSASQRVQAEHYLQLLLEQNKSLNLTGVRTLPEAPVRTSNCMLFV